VTGWQAIVPEPLRRFAGSQPQLRAVLLPIWLGYRDLLWKMHKARGLPVLCAAGLTQVRLHPQGQIPEVLWKWDFEQVERDFVQSYVRPGMRVLNIGANVGLYCVMASALVGSNGEVHAFEPSTESFDLLLKNLALNGCSNVIAKRMALSDQNGELLLRADPKSPHLDGHRFIAALDAVRQRLDTDEIVRALTLDEYIASLAIDARGMDLVILDVEGAELAVLRGGSALLAQPNLTVLMECSKNKEAVYSMLRGFGYEFWSWNRESHSLQKGDFFEVTKTGDVIARRSVWSTLP
jgi:FkbM family methyltransferase